MKITDCSKQTKHDMTTAGILAALGLAVFLSFGALSGAQRASATSFSTLWCVNPSNSNVNTTNVALNTQVKCHVESTNPNVDGVHYWVTNSNGVNVTDSGLASYTSGTKVYFNFNANLAGDWAVHTNFYDVDGNAQPICVCMMHVTFFVLPESALGPIGLMGSSLAALGLFMHYSRSQKKKASESSD